MIQEILIQRIVNGDVTKGEGDCTTPLTGKYFDKNLNRNINLLTSFKVAYDRDLLAHETLWTHLFSKSSKYFSLKWDTIPEDDSDEAKQRVKDKEEWVARLLQHPQVQNAENKNIQGSFKFVLIDKRKKDINDFTLNNNKVVVFNMIKNMEVDELMDVAFFSMMNPAKDRLSTIQIFNRLCSLTDGVLMVGDASEKFLSDWKMPDATYQKVIRKAILLNVITSESGIFKINNDIIGSGIDDLVAYMKTNTRIYEFVKSEVASKDTLPYDVTKIKTVSEVLLKIDINRELRVDGRTKTPSEKVDSKVERDTNDAKYGDDLAKAKIKMRELGIKGWQSPFLKLDTALSRIMEKESELLKVKEPV